MPPLMAFIPPIRALLLSPPPPLPLHRKEKKGSMPKETRDKGAVCMYKSKRAMMALEMELEEQDELGLAH